MFLIDGVVKSFNIITPNGGDLIYAGTSTFIYWESIKNQINNVDLYYSVNNGKDWILIQNNVENNGVYNWVVPPSIKYSGQCLVKLFHQKILNILECQTILLQLKQINYEEKF